MISQQSTTTPTAHPSPLPLTSTAHSLSRLTPQISDMNTSPWTAVFAIPELLSLIFINCLPDNGYALPDSTTFPTTLALVCRKWRDLAYATPRLWSSIDMAKGRHFCHPSERLADAQRVLLRRWLTRSGAVPLRLHMSYGGGEDILERQILAPILQRSSRWQELDITASFESVQAILERIRRGAPFLSEVHLGSTSYRRPSNPSCSLLSLHLSNSPHLKRFVCNGSHLLHLDASSLPPSLNTLRIAISTLSIPPHPQDFPSTNVRNLSLNRVSCPNVPNLLDLLGSAFRNVEELKLEIVGACGSLRSIAQLRHGFTVDLPHLRTFTCKTNFSDIELPPFPDLGADLDINTNTDTDADLPTLYISPEAAFLSRLRLPSLTNLTFSVFTDDVLPSLASLFRRSSHPNPPPLTHLRLHGFIPTSFNVRAFLSELPALTRLHIHNATHDDEVTKNVLTALTVRSAHPAPPRVHGRLNLDDDDVVVDGNSGSPEPYPCPGSSRTKLAHPPLCPLLTHFEFAVWISRITPNYVTEMILSRCRTLSMPHPADAYSSTPSTSAFASSSSSASEAFPQVAPLQRFALSLLPSNAQAVLQHPDIVECMKNGLQVECEK